MSIQGVHGIYTLECDNCYHEADIELDSFHEAVEWKKDKSNLWSCRKHEGCWQDLCPRCNGNEPTDKSLEPDYKDKISKHRITSGRMIKSYDDWKALIVELYSEHWVKVSKKNLIAAFGEPSEYPVIVTFYINTLDAFQNKNLHLIYLRDDKMEGYSITESDY